MIKHTLLAGRLLDFLGLVVSDKSVVGLEFLQRLVGIVDESKTGSLAATIVGSQSEGRDGVLLNLIGLSEPLAKFILGDVL